MRNIFFVPIVICLSVFCLGSFSDPDEMHPHPYTLLYPDHYGDPLIPADNPMTVEGVWLGRLLFYDPIISVNGKMACSSCHQQKLFFTDGRALAIGVHGDTLERNTMSIVNLAWEKYFFWDGRDTSLEEVVTDHISNPLELGGISEQELIRRIKQHKNYPQLFKQAFPNDTISLNTVSKAIAQFTRTIILKFNNGPERFKQNGNIHDQEMLMENSHDAAVARISLMQCKKCHGKAAGGQSLAVYQDDCTYKAPTLINIRYTGPYMHDGRFKTLKEVFLFYRANLNDIQAKNPHLMKEVESSPSFTDYDIKNAENMFSNNADASICSDPEFSNPFIRKGFNWAGTKKKTNRKN